MYRIEKEFNFNHSLYQIRVAVKSRLKNIGKRHENKLFNLRKQEQLNQSSNEKVNNCIKSIVNNFPSYQLSDDELTALSYGLDHHIPNKLNRNRIHTEFEEFYQNLIKDLSHILDENLTHLKTKLRNTCEHYSKIHVPFKYKRIIDSLSKNQSIFIMKQDKGRGVVVMDRSKYTEKYLSILQTEQFTNLRHDLTKSIENKIQRELRKLKTRLTIQEYRQLYPTGSNPGRFYGTAKLHKLPPNGTIEDLPIRPLVSNIGTASYHLAKYLAQNLSPLGQSTYSIKSTFDLMGKIKNEQMPLGFTMVSFDVKALFTSIPLTETIDIILDRNYNRKEISTALTKNEMKKLLTLCTKNVHFTLNNEIYVQNDGVAMGSRLGPILANVFMWNWKTR